MNRYIRIEISQLLGIMLICGTLGYLTGYLYASLMLSVVVYFIKHGYYLIQLGKLIESEENISPPYPPDIWGLIYKELARQRMRSRKRKRTLNRFASRFRKVATSIPDALLMLNKPGRLEWANPAANQLLNISWPRDEGVPITQLLHIEGLKEYLESPDYNKPIDFPSPSNKAIILSLRITPFGSKKAQRLLVARDTTELYNLNQTRRDFVSNVSHELRTPLTVISGFLENLSDNEMLEFQKRPFDLMLQQAERMNSIINDLLALSRLEMGKAPSSEKPVLVPDLIRKIVDQAKALGEQKGGYEITTDIDESLCLLGEENELLSAFSNLLNNAIIHTPPKTKIGVAWKREENIVSFSVTDTGPGIEQAAIPRLTERFYRVDKARSRQSGGTGLGLAIVKHIIGRHDGELRITSQPGMGSQFKCTFPNEMALDKSQLQQHAAS